MIALTDDSESEFRFLEFTPAEVMKACTIPPFKIYFNVDVVSGQPKQSKHREGTVALSEESFGVLNAAYKSLRN